MVCPHCGKADWAKAPRSRAILLYVQKRGDTTSAEVAGQFGISIQNAANAMSRLCRMGLLRHNDGEAHPNGGVVRTYYPTGADL